MAQNKKRMKSNEISDFVAELIAAGCDICAVGHDMYVIGDGDLVPDATEEVRRIGEKYGDRDALKLEIATYLCSMGRCVEVGVEATRH